MTHLGIIADDFTGATDIASFLVQNGLSTIQFNGVPQCHAALSAQAIVVSLKSRSCPAEQAVAQSLAALRWLEAQGCDRFYFKYCSTFDSTEQGQYRPGHRRAASGAGGNPDGDLPGAADQRPHRLSWPPVCRRAAAERLRHAPPSGDADDRQQPAAPDETSGERQGGADRRAAARSEHAGGAQQAEPAERAGH